MAALDIVFTPSPIVRDFRYWLLAKAPYWIVWTVDGITNEVRTLASGNLHRIVLALLNKTPSTAE